MTTLNLALITYGPKGAQRISSMNLPQLTGVSYVVSWQAHANAQIPATLERNDITILRTDTAGAAINRNNAIAHCTADLVLFSDDDLIYTPSQLQSVIDTFNSNPTVELATFMATHPAGPKYPTEACRLGNPLPKGYFVSSYQIAFRRTAIGNLLCHPEFGAGAKEFIGADDELFLLAAIRRGINCHFFPINICTHPQLSTGTTETLSPGNLRAMGCYMALAYPKSIAPRIILKAMRVFHAKQAPFLTALRHLFAGASSAPRILRGDKKYIW